MSDELDAIPELPAHIDLTAAMLPENYRRAVQALAECERVDQCREWANQAAAIASYAKQARDDTLYQLARRIKARATYRCGELLKQFDARGQHRKNGTSDISSRTEAAKSVGMTERERTVAVRIANIPKETFEAVVEVREPPSITRLSQLGIKKRTAAIPAIQIVPIAGPPMPALPTITNIDLARLQAAQAPRLVCQALQTIAVHGRACAVEQHVEAIRSAHPVDRAKYVAALHLAEEILAQLRERRIEPPSI